MLFRFLDPELSLQRVISVDGVAPLGPNFSHWPGHRTPAALCHDVSTGIALNWARLPAAERERLIEGLDVVTNTHIDTDGILSVFTFMHPDVALEHADLLQAAATTGDFQTFTTHEALAIELTLTALQDSDPEIAALEGPQKRQRQYESALDLVPLLLEDPFVGIHRIEADYKRILADVDIARGSEVRVEEVAAHDLAIVHAPRELDRVAFNTAARDRSRVLTLVPHGRGHLVRLVQRVDSWFHMVSRVVPARTELAGLAERLEALEAPEAEAHWHAHAIDDPVPECWFGELGSGKSFGPMESGALSVSRLAPRLIVRAVVEHFERGQTTPRPFRA